ncbi:unnamed protein product [Ectocarpus sp. 12 AP-2014]
MHREAKPSFINRASKSIAGDEKNNNVPSEDPALPPTTLETAVNSPFLAFPTKLSLMMKFGFARASPPPPPAKEVEKERWWAKVVKELKQEMTDPTPRD